MGRLLNYLLVPLYTRVFIPEEYGVITEMYAYLAFFLVLLTYGMETTFFRFSNKEESLGILPLFSWSHNNDIVSAKSPT